MLRICFFVISGISIAYGNHSFVEDDIKLEPSIIIQNENISESDFYALVDVAQNVYQQYALENSLKPLSIYSDYQNNTVNASCTPQLNSYYINIYGGLAKHPDMTFDALALVLCHELGHAYGGKPDKLSPVFKVSVEGQADFYATQACMAKILPYFPQEHPWAPTLWMKTKCQNEKDPLFCQRVLHAGLSVGKLLSFLKKQPIPQYETPDMTQVRKTLKSYPQTIQCRLDTYALGILQKERPRCWYAP